MWRVGCAINRKSESKAIFDGRKGAVPGVWVSLTEGAWALKQSRAGIVLRA